MYIHSMTYLCLADSLWNFTLKYGHQIFQLMSGVSSFPTYNQVVPSLYLLLLQQEATEQLLNSPAQSSPHSKSSPRHTK